jgi:NADPH:quinone reductase-like Zn-dependent oxidoreductase
MTIETPSRLPVVTTAVVLPAYEENLLRAILSLRTEKVPLPRPGPGEVMVQLLAAPVNPSDIAFMRGDYRIRKPLPAIPGFEGSGRVVAAGAGCENLINKRAACFVQDDHSGTWSEYFLARASDCLIVKDELDDDQAACLAVNPFTAYGLTETASGLRAPAIILNAALSRVAFMVRMLCRLKGIKTINLVRKPDQVGLLKEQGENHVLCSADKDFPVLLREMAHAIGASLAFDAVAGEGAGVILNAMPDASRLVVYGGLSGLPLSGFNALGMIFQHKKIEGFNLGEWMAGKLPEELQEISCLLQEMIIRGDFRTDIQASFSLDNAAGALKSYIRNMSKGKVLLKPAPGRP